MSRLYIRHRDGLWLTFINSKEELKDLEFNMIPGRRVTIADLNTFNQTMRLMLLKLLEENPEALDCYSSVDITDSILLSRFTEVIKEPLSVASGSNEDAWKDCKRDYMNAVQMHGDKKLDVQLRLPLVGSQMDKFLLGL